MSFSSSVAQISSSSQVNTSSAILNSPSLDDGMDTTQVRAQTVQLLVPDTNGERARVFSACIRQMVSHSGTTYEKCAYFASAIQCFLHELSPTVRNMFEDIGCVVNQIKLPSQDAQYGIDVPSHVVPLQCYIILGQLFYILFNKLNSATYRRCILKTIAEMKANFGYIPEYSEDLVAVGFQDARIINETLASKTDFKTRLIESIMACKDKKNGFGSLCNYVSRSISWNGMTDLAFLFNSVLSKDSSILTDVRIVDEVSNLRLAYETCNRCPYPQFFGILANVEEAVLIDVSRFPVLISVARKIRSKVERIILEDRVELSDILNDTVEELAQVHVAFMTKQAIEYLTQVDANGNYITSESDQFGFSFMR